MSEWSTTDEDNMSFPMDLSATNNATGPQAPDGRSVRSSVVVLSRVATGPVHAQDIPSTSYDPPRPGRSTASLSPLDPNSTADQLETQRSNAAVASASAYIHSSYNNFVYANYNPYYQTAVVATTEYQASFEHHEQQRIQFEKIQQQQIQQLQYQQQQFQQQQYQQHQFQQQQIQQLQIQQQQFQQQQIHQHRLHQHRLQMQMAQQIGVNTMMRAQSTAGPPYGWATSVLPTPTSSSDRSVPFVFGSVAYDQLAEPTYDPRYPYFNGFVGGGCGCSCGIVGATGCGYGNSGDGGRSADNPPPRSPGLTAEELDTANHATAVYKRRCEIIHQLNASLVALRWLEAGSASTESDPEPEEIAAIYNRPEFQSFRQRYLEDPGPARNVEKVRRSMAGMKIDGQTSCGPKRKKVNEASKKSRDAKRLKSIETEICVMYLTKKVNEMKEIKVQLMQELQRYEFQ